MTSLLECYFYKNQKDAEDRCLSDDIMCVMLYMLMVFSEAIKLSIHPSITNHPNRPT